MTHITVHLDDGNVELLPDGMVLVSLNGMHAARHDLYGVVVFSWDGKIETSRVEDAYVSTPLKPHVVRAAENAARRQAAKARRVARQIARTTKPVVQHEPGTLEHLILLAEGKIREDGWPRGHMPLLRFPA